MTDAGLQCVRGLTVVEVNVQKTQLSINPYFSQTQVHLSVEMFNVIEIRSREQLFIST